MAHSFLKHTASDGILHSCFQLAQKVNAIAVVVISYIKATVFNFFMFYSNLLTSKTPRTIQIQYQSHWILPRIALIIIG